MDLGTVQNKLDNRKPVPVESKTRHSPPRSPRSSQSPRARKMKTPETASIGCQKYVSFREFVDDVNLTFSNAIRYNPVTHPVHQTALALRKIFDDIVNSTKDRLHFPELKKSFSVIPNQQSLSNQNHAPSPENNKDLSNCSLATFICCLEQKNELLALAHGDAKENDNHFSGLLYYDNNGQAKILKEITKAVERMKYDLMVLKLQSLNSVVKSECAIDNSVTSDMAKAMDIEDSKMTLPYLPHGTELKKQNLNQEAHDRDE